MPRKRLILKINSAERKELNNLIHHESSSKSLVSRCKIILLTDAGVPMQEIAEILDLSKTTVNTWRQIYLAQGLEGLKVKRRRGRPSKIARDILFRHFPGLDGNISLALKKALNKAHKSTPLLSKSSQL